jgi:hypothetical protein
MAAPRSLVSSTTQVGQVDLFHCGLYPVITHAGAGTAQITVLFVTQDPLAQRSPDGFQVRLILLLEHGGGPDGSGGVGVDDGVRRRTRRPDKFRNAPCRYLSKVTVIGPDHGHPASSKSRDASGADILITIKTLIAKSQN